MLATVMSVDANLCMVVATGLQYGTFYLCIHVKPTSRHIQIVAHDQHATSTTCCDLNYGFCAGKFSLHVSCVLQAVSTEFAQG